MIEGAVGRHGWLSLLAVQVLACAACDGDVVPSTIAVTIDGDGQGWVRDETSKRICTESCELDVDPTLSAAGEPPRALLQFGTTQTVTASRDFSTPTRQCGVALVGNPSITVTFSKQDKEVSTLYLDQSPRAIGFVAGDLVLVAGTDLRRLGFDGTVRWAVPTAATQVATDDSMIVVGPEVAAYHADGSPAWTSSVVAVDIALGPDGPVAMTSDGRMIALARADGMPRWTVALPGGKHVAVDPSGNVAASAGAEIYRYDRLGAPLAPGWLAPAPIDRLAFTRSGAAYASYTTNVAAGGGHPLRDAHLIRFTPSSRDPGPTTTTRTAGGFGFAPLGDGAFVFSRFAAYWHTTPVPAGGFLQLVDENGATPWTQVKGFTGSVGSGVIWIIETLDPTIGACDGREYCAVFGTYEGGPIGWSNWLEVLRFP